MHHAFHFWGFLISGINNWVSSDRPPRTKLRVKTLSTQYLP